MVTMSLTRESHAFTRADLHAMPDDGRRHELIDGSLIVTPAPSLRHQVAVSRLVQILQRACPDQLLVLFAPTDVRLSDDTLLQPDVFVIERPRSLDEAGDLRPLIVVEVLSPSTRQIDLTLKMSRYEEAGTPTYWVVDASEPSITAWTLADGRYADPTIVVGTEVLETCAPFDLTISPSQLVI